jgi:hypothetical protein
MFSEKRSPEDKDKHLNRMEPYADNKSQAISNSGVLKRADVSQKTGAKAYSIKYATRNKCCSIRIE